MLAVIVSGPTVLKSIASAMKYQSSVRTIANAFLVITLKVT